MYIRVDLEQGFYLQRIGLESLGGGVTPTA
jgi:hypothetical protein